MDEARNDTAKLNVFDDDENDWDIAPLDESKSHADANEDVLAFLQQLDAPSMCSQESSNLPAELHPAVSLGMQRVSSCYFSIPGSEASNSVADLLSLVDEHDHDAEEALDSPRSAVQWNAAEVLYHDIMMHVFTFLDVSALAAFSQTALRPNFECFYFLQLQLQSSIVAMPERLVLSGTSILSRLAQMDEPCAHSIVQTYVDSNSTLRQMPLSHSLAYIRHVLERNGFQQHIATGSPSHALASAAFLITLIGAASVMGTDSSYSAMLPNMLKVGLAGSLMGAGVTATAANNENLNAVIPMRETAERMARMMQELPLQLLEQLHSLQTKREVNVGLMAFPSSIAARIYGAFLSAYGPIERREEEEQQHKGSKHCSKAVQENPVHHPISSNPYEHLPDSGSETLTTKMHKISDRVPSGCVGAYSKAIRRATQKVISLVQDERKANYSALSVDEKGEISRVFLESCSSDHSLSIVQDMLRVQKSVDVDGFYVGVDGTETCALHTAAFHGACRVLDFLCQGLSDHGNDGGLANVNIRDTNGWTALHFAAGANSVEAVRILATHGAQLAVEANNGYTPFQWAQRLSNALVAEELQKLGADQRFLLEHSFSSMAHRLFRMSRIQAT